MKTFSCWYCVPGGEQGKIVLQMEKRWKTLVLHFKRSELKKKGHLIVDLPENCRQQIWL